MSEPDVDENGTPTAQDYGASDGVGIMDRMASVLDGEPDPVAADAVEALASSTLTDDKEVKKTIETPETSEETPAKVIEEEKPKAEEKEEPEMDEGFFNDEEEKPEEKPEGEFDEASFDAQTTKEVEGLDPKQGDAWKALKAELKEYKKGAASPDIQEKMQELEMKAAEAEGLRAKIEVLSGKSARLRVESSDAYSQRVIDPATKILGKVDEMAKFLEADPDVIRAIVKERDFGRRREAINKHLTEVSELDRSEIYRLSQDFSSILDISDSMMEHAEKEVEAEELRTMEADKKMLSDQRTAVQSIQKNLWEKYENAVPGFADEDGIRTETMDKLMAQGMAIDFSKAKAKDQAYAAFAGVTLPHVMKQVKTLQKQLSDYEKAEGKKNRGKPSASSSIGETPVKKKGEGETFMERLANADFS